MDTLQKSVDRVDRDMSNDRKDIQDLRIAVGSLQAEQAQLREQVNSLPKKVGEKVTDAVEPINNALDQVQKKSFWDKLIKRGR